MPEVRLYHGDCLDILPTLEAGSVDAVITDPPYGIGYASSRTTRMDGSKRTSDSAFGEDVVIGAWLPEMFRICRDDSCLYFFTRWDVVHIWKALSEASGFIATQRLVWDKRHWGMGDLRYYGSQTEDVLFCRKGNPTMRYEKRRGDMFTCASRAYLPEGKYNHPTQKPEKLMREFIEDSTLPGDTVIDPFMGSGTTGVACVQTGRNFIGIEIDRGYYEIAERRIAEAQAQMRLPLEPAYA